MHWSMYDGWPVGTPIETKLAVCIGKSLRSGTARSRGLEAGVPNVLAVPIMQI